MLLGLILSDLAALIVIAGVMLALIYFVIRFRQYYKEDKVGSPRKCGRCGYIVTKLSAPRCPECGAAVGFDKTFSELGVDEVEVIRHTDRRRRDSAQGEAPDEPSDESEPLQ